MSDKTKGPYQFKLYTCDERQAEETRRLLGKEPPRLINNDGSVPILDANGHAVACVLSRIHRTRKTPYDAPDEERDATARLIAAAPELLKALEAVMLRANLVYQMGDAEARQALVAVYEIARAAIAKAKEQG